MIARFRILLPYSFDLIADESLIPLRTRFEQYDITIHPPLQAGITLAEARSHAMPLVSERFRQGLAPSTPPKIEPGRLVNDQPSFSANLLQIDFQQPIKHHPYVTIAPP